MDKNQWLDPQPWERDIDAPCLSLGAAGQFDDTHIFAPCVALENGRYYMWYSGSRGEVDLRVFALGLATSDDGLHFTRHPASPVCTLDDRPLHPHPHPGAPPGRLPAARGGQAAYVFFLDRLPLWRHTPHPARHDQRRRTPLGDALPSPIRKRLRPHPILGRRPLPPVVHRCDRRPLDHTRRPPATTALSGKSIPSQCWNWIRNGSSSAWSIQPFSKKTVII